MKNGISSKDYYKLLEWKDENMSEWLYLSSNVYGVERMCEMTTKQLNHLKNMIKKNNEKK
jgi:hypothetical protein